MTLCSGRSSEVGKVASKVAGSGGSELPVIRVDSRRFFALRGSSRLFISGSVSSRSLDSERWPESSVFMLFSGTLDAQATEKATERGKKRQIG